MNPREILERRLQRTSSPATHGRDSSSITRLGSNSELPNVIRTAGGKIAELKVDSEGSALVFKRDDTEFTGARHKLTIRGVIYSAIAGARGFFRTLSGGPLDGRHGFEITYEGGLGPVAYRGMSSGIQLGVDAELDLASARRNGGEGHLLKTTAGIYLGNSVETHELEFTSGSSGKAITEGGSFTWES